MANAVRIPRKAVSLLAKAVRKLNSDPNRALTRLLQGGGKIECRPNQVPSVAACGTSEDALFELVQLGARLVPGVIAKDHFYSWATRQPDPKTHAVCNKLLYSGKSFLEMRVCMCFVGTPR